MTSQRCPELWEEVGLAGNRAEEREGEKPRITGPCPGQLGEETGADAVLKGCTSRANG